MPPRKTTRSRSKQSSPQSKAAVSAAASTHSRGAMKLTSDYRPANLKKKRAGPYKMPPPIPSGEVLTDFKKNKWCLGTSVGKGGFGEIYTACRSGCSIDEDQYVIKIEPHENGPLFTELSFYTRIAKPERICEWVKSHKLPYLAIPKFIASGCHDRGGTKFRFMVMERFGEDIEKKFTAAGRRFSLGTVCYLALQLLDALEFLHESEYVHADVKGSNLLTGFGEEQAHKVYLVDYGLAYRYCPDGEHKQYKEDPRKAHDGTIEFTSIDAHKGVSPSRRSDLEILGYCLIQWACGRLPWEENLENKDKVAKMKFGYRCDAEALLKACYGGVDFPPCLQDYMEVVYGLDYQEKPNYIKLKQLFTKQLRILGCRGDGRDTLDWITSSKVGEKRKARGKDEIEEVESPPPTKKKRITKRAAAAGVGGSPTVNSAPSPAATAGVVGKQSVVSQRRATTSKRQRNGSKTKQPVVYYPKSLGYADRDGSSSSSEEEEVQRSAQKKRKTCPKKPAQAKKVLGEVDSDSEEFSPKRRRIAKTTRTTRRKT